MNGNQQAAYVQAMAACAIIEAAGMTAENQDRISKGLSIAYDESAFNALIEKYGIHQNAVMNYMQDIQDIPY